MRLLAVFIFFFTLPYAAFAHAFGFSHEASVNGYLVDIGFSTAAPTPKEAVIFDFNLPIEHSDVSYTQVWVRVTGPDGNVTFAGGLDNAMFGGPRMSYIFPDPGTYTIYVRYENNADPLLETSFTITAVPDTGSGATSDLVVLFPALLVGLLVGGGAVFFYTRRR